MLCAVACSNPDRPKNVLLVSIDTLRADHLGCYGYERPTSPALDALAEQGQLFEAAISSSSWTLPSMASLMTASAARVHGCTNVSSALHPGERTLAESLHAAGYDTAAVVSHTFVGRRYGFGQGVVWFDDELVHEIKESHAAITSPTIAERGIVYLQQKAETRDQGPWFLWLHFFDPHEDLKVHEGISERFGTREPIDLYDGEIAFTDRHIGRVFAALDELGLADETIVVVVADHGESFEPPRDPLLDGPLSDTGHGTHLYEEVIRVPLMFRVPGLEPRRIGHTISVADVMPTLLELTGTGAGARLRDRSFADLLTGGTLDSAPVLSELRPFNGHECDAIVDGRWKLIDDITRKKVRLFDLDADPGELRDVSAAHAERTAAMLSELERMREQLHGERRFGVRSIELSPAERSNLQDLGYVGD